MKKHLLFIWLFLFALLINSCTKEDPEPDDIKIVGKQIYIPYELRNMDFNSTKSQWSYHRMDTSENIVVFWEEGFGEIPSKAEDEDMRFGVKSLLNNAEKFYTYYRDSLKFIENGSLLDTYRLMIMVLYTDDWLATGAGYDNKVGALWVSPSTLQPAGDVIAHEIGHSFQYQVACDGHYGFRDQNYVGSFWEQCAQYMARQIYPAGMLYDMKFFVDNSYMNFSNEEIRYQSFYLQEYWKIKHGKDFLGRLWREAITPEHPLQAYMRITNITQEQLNDEVCEYAMRNIIWDYQQGSYIRNMAANLNAVHKTELTAVDENGTYEVSATKAPECYGYNAFRLTLPSASTEVSATFKGLDNSFSDLSGWRYGFVGVKTDGKSAIYGSIGKDQEGSISFTVTDQIQSLWFVVSGAPTSHWNHPWGIAANLIPKFPYQVKFTNTLPQ